MPIKIGRGIGDWSAWWRWIARAAAVVLVATVVLQSVETRALRESVRDWRRRAQWPASGITFPPLHTRTLDGASRVVGAAGPRPQIIAVFNASCPHCRVSLPQWRRLTQRADSSHEVEMVWLSLSARDSTAAYVRDQELPVAHVAIEPDRALVLAARMRGVPLTLVVDTGGVIRHVFAGEVTALEADSVWLVARTPRAPGTTAPRPPSQPVAFHSETTHTFSTRD